MNKVEEIFEEINSKLVRSKRNYVILNIIAFFLSAGLVILNLFAIRFNPASEAAMRHEGDAMAIISVFICLAILSGLSGLVTSVISFFVFRQKSKQSKDKVVAIRLELKMHSDKEGAYADEDRDKVLIEKITKIKNQA